MTDTSTPAPEATEPSEALPEASEATPAEGEPQPSPDLDKPAPRPMPRPKNPGRKKRTEPRKEPDPVGRPTRMTPDKIDQIATAVAGHLSLESAAELVGVSKDAVYYWFKKGQEARRNKYTEFAERIKSARALAKLDLVTKVAGAPDWRAAAWMLERRHREEFHIKTITEISGPNGGPIESTNNGPAVQIILQGMDAGADNPYANPDDLTDDLPDPAPPPPPIRPVDVAKE